MPVTFLRTPADYFGIQEAPAQPLFQQTRALADPAVQNQLGFMDKVTQLRQRRPLARAQAMQNEYDSIFANADRLRMQQEAAKQAEQAVSALAGLTPEADDYVAQRQQIQRQFPSAMLDPRVQRIVDDNDQVFRGRQSAIAKQQAEREGLTAELTEAGMTDLNEAARIASLGRPAVGAAKYQLGKGGGVTENPRLKMIKGGLDTLAETIRNTPEDIETADGQFIPNPARKSLLDKYSQYSSEYQSELDKALFPQTEKVSETVKTPVGSTKITETTKPSPQAEQPSLDAQLASLPFSQQQAFLEKKKAEEESAKAIAPAWDKAKRDIGSKIAKIIPDKTFEGTGINQLESFAKAVLEPNNNIIQHPEYGTIPVAWDVLNKAGVPMADIMNNETVFREPGEGRRVLGFIGTQQVGYQELLREWARDYLNKKGRLLPTSQSPTGSTLTPQQAKDFEELKALVGSK
jgi:hypothetical protein